MTDKQTEMIDVDAMLAKRAEEVGSVDKFPFMFKGNLPEAKQWWAVDPLVADDDWHDDLREISEDEDATLEDIAAHYLGDQWDAFKEAGGHSGIWRLVFNDFQVKHQRSMGMDADGNPTRGRRSSNRAQRRQKRR